MLFARRSGAEEDSAKDVRATETLLKTGALQSAIFNSANFSSIATDASGVIQIFNVGAERMLGYAAADVEDLDDALGVGGDTGEVGAVEDCVLQGAGLEQRFLAPEFHNALGAALLLAADST